MHNLEIEAHSGQPVDEFIKRFDISHPAAVETLHEFPDLRFLLGRVSDKSSGTDDRPDNNLRPVYYLREGSGMFGLTIPDDAMRWRGIFNHIMGTARQVYWLADRLSRLSSQQIQAFDARGYDGKSFASVRPIELRDFMFVSHAGRRQSDEYTWHGLRDSVHPSGDSGLNTYTLLRKEGASAQVLELMRVEMHADHLVSSLDADLFPNIVDNILTYPDWTFGQAPNTLAERFIGLRKSQRASTEILDILERCGNTFEGDLQEIVDPDIFRRMTHAGPYDWETKIRRAYSAPSGLSIGIVFPGYIV